MGHEAQVLIHEVGSFAIEKIGKIEDEVTLLKKISDRVLNIFADRAAEAGRSGTASDPFTNAQLRHGWARRDWWLGSDECLRGGIVDEVR
jgi:ATP-dependent protease ClpP protease subunit